MAIPVRGDRAARDSKNYPELHASDLEEGAGLQHLPQVSGDGDILERQSGAWVPVEKTSLPLDDWGTPGDNTDLNATTEHHGLLPKLSGDEGDVLKGDGSWGEAPAGVTKLADLSDMNIVEPLKNAFLTYNPLGEGDGEWRNNNITPVHRQVIVWDAFIQEWYTADVGDLDTRTWQALFTVEGSLEVSTGKLKIPNAVGRTLAIVRLYAIVDVAPDGDDIIIDVLVDGTSIFTDPADRLKILDGETTGIVEFENHKLWLAYSNLSMNIAQVGSVEPGQNLTCALVYIGVT